MPGTDVAIVGAGLAGLCCAIRLQERGIPCVILEASDGPGGRVRTDRVDGFQLDRGFQVLLTAYPEARLRLDYDQLALGRFHAGAYIRTQGVFHKLGDPLRHLADALPSLIAPVGSLLDKWKINGLRSRVCGPPLESLYERPEVTTLEELRTIGFSAKMIERFFQPFFAGIFLEPDLVTSSRKFEFVFRMFSQGEAALPAAGMQAIPDQLASHLRPGTLQLNTRVTRLDQIDARRIILAVDQPSAARLAPSYIPAPAAVCKVSCHYYAAPVSPVRGRWLVLNGEGSGPINNLCVPSEVCPQYAPSGQSLVSVSSLAGAPEPGIRTHLRLWYGPQVDEWRALRSYQIPYALTLQAPPALTPVAKPVKLGDRLYVCGDYTDTASIQGAMISGRRAADAL